jgi:hypothetical protein
MKKIIDTAKITQKASVALVACLLLSVASCDLDKYPYGSIVKDAAFQSVDDAKTFNTALYAHLRGAVYGVYMLSPDIQTDLFHSSISFGNNYGSVYTWTFVSSDYDIRDVWAGCYSRIANVNNFLDNVDAIATETDEERATLDVLKGEAYFLRAFYYEKLVKRFAKDYEPASADSDPGVPLTLTFDVNAQPARASVAETYEQILADLAAAKPLLTTKGAPGADSITKDCITALEARVYLDMHRYSDAVTAANTLINSGTYPLVSTADDLRQVWVNDAVNESIFMLFASKPNELSNTNDQYLGFLSATNRYRPNFIPEQWVVDLYDDNDIRKEVFLKELPVSIENIETNLVLLNKYPGNPALYDGVTNYQHKCKVFRIAEAYLIKAEALAYNNQDAPALAALNDLRTKRGLSAATGLTGDALKKEIQNERTRELIGEGTRLDDLKRWKLGVTRGAAQNADAVSPGANYCDLSKQVNDNKFVWAIPSREIMTNPNLVQNPGWGE